MTETQDKRLQELFDRMWRQDLSSDEFKVALNERLRLADELDALPAPHTGAVQK